MQDRFDFNLSPNLIDIFFQIGLICYVNKQQIVTILILMGLFGGLAGGPIASLLNYQAYPLKRFWLFIIPEFIGFTCAGI
jgi:hypothetical protein